MAKVTRWVTDPYAGGHCTLVLDSGEKIVVKHEKGEYRIGWLTIDQSKFLGFNRERVFVCNLQSPAGVAALKFLTRNAEADSVEATPLGAFVKYLETSRSIGEIKTRCAAVMAIHQARSK
jgi:hypothetical protein